MKLGFDARLKLCVIAQGALIVLSFLAGYWFGHQNGAEIPTAAAEKTVVVQPGDTLSGLALQHLGDASRWGELADINHLPEPEMLPVGTVLTIPKE